MCVGLCVSVQQQEPAFDKSELALYANMILVEGGKHERALEHLQQKEAVLLDKLVVMETKGALIRVCSMCILRCVCACVRVSVAGKLLLKLAARRRPARCMAHRQPQRRQPRLPQGTKQP